MSHATLTRPTPTTTVAAAAPASPGVVVDNRSSYLAWGLTWLVGQGAFALASGPDPLVPMPALLPAALGEGKATLETLPTGLSSQVLLRRPDVLLAERRLLAENANSGAARAALFPNISLTAAVGTISTALSGLFGGGSFTYSASPRISLPLFDGGRRQANVEVARAQQLAAVATYEDTLQTAFREVADALTGHSRVETWVASTDTAGQRAATWAGMHREGVRRGLASGGEPEDRIVYARLVTDAPVSEPGGFRSILNGTGTSTRVHG